MPHHVRVRDPPRVEGLRLLALSLALPLALQLRLRLLVQLLPRHRERLRHGERELLHRREGRRGVQRRGQRLSAELCGGALPRLFLLQPGHHSGGRKGKGQLASHCMVLRPCSQKKDWGELRRLPKHAWNPWALPAARTSSSEPAGAPPRAAPWRARTAPARRAPRSRAARAPARPSAEAGAPAWPGQCGEQDGSVMRREAHVRRNVCHARDDVKSSVEWGEARRKVLRTRLEERGGRLLDRSGRARPRPSAEGGRLGDGQVRLPATGGSPALALALQAQAQPGKGLIVGCMGLIHSQTRLRRSDT